MDTAIIMAEITSPALKQVVKELISAVDRVSSGEIKYQQGSVEIVGCKHVIQALALDWAVSAQTKQIPGKVVAEAVQIEQKV